MALLNSVRKGMAENVIAILRYLSSDASPLPSLTAGYTRPTTVFFSDFGRFIQYQFSTALLMYGTLFSLSVSLAWFVHRERVPGSRSGSRSPAGASASGFWMTQWNGVRALLFAFGGALICANGLAVIMHRVVGRNMSWFAVEHSALLLYGPAALTGSSLYPHLPNIAGVSYSSPMMVNSFAIVVIGMLISQTVLVPGVVGMEKERNVLTALLLMQSGGALAVQLIGLGSAYFLFINAVPLFVALSLDALLSRGSGVVSLWTYALGMLMPLFTGAKMACIVFDVFVPLVCFLHAPRLLPCARG
jgi:hypothetical protein